MKYAVIKTGGKQYRVSEGDVISIERLTAEGKDITFSEVLLYHVDGNIKVGAPFVNGVTVRASLVEHNKGEKIRVSKYKAKVRYRRVTGHRQLLSLVKIDTIGDGGSKTARKAEVETPKTVRKTVARKKVTA